jgi:hypothetical protein
MNSFVCFALSVFVSVCDLCETTGVLRGVFDEALAEFKYANAIDNY